MTTYYFDVQGTLEHNVAGAGKEDCMLLLDMLRSVGHRVIVWSGGDIPEMWSGFADETRDKRPASMIDGPMNDVVVVDDDDLVLRMMSRFGARVVHASELATWVHGQAPALYTPQPLQRCRG